ncbi:MAG: glycolate oxidase subunit GlcF, partial [Burkholderiaceae bacterium]|nr:glycolate oxidase subunit GlcF [Burkholderiaceae bacterium]
LPPALRAKVPARQDAGAWPVRRHARKMLLLEGCVQPSMMPNVNSATARVLDAAGIETVVAAQAGCCGAVRFHLDDQEGARAQMRANIDAWWPHVEQGAEAIVMNASGCGVMVKDYAHALRADPVYAARAQRVAALTRDLSELLPLLLPALRGKVSGAGRRLAFHPPCTLQHGQQLRGGVELALGELGFDVALAPADAHLCCGSAGTYSVLQPDLAKALRERKLAQLRQTGAECIVSANVGCIAHLQGGTDTPVRHWVELLDAARVS